MRYVRFQRRGEDAVRLGWIEDERIGSIEGPLFGAHRRIPVTWPSSTVKLLSPLIPGKIVCVGRNYIEHAREHDAEVPEVPLLFLKPPSAVIGPRDPIILPVQSEQVEHEAELAVIIGRKARQVAPNEARDYIFGYTAANDVTARDLQRKDGQWIDTEVDPGDLRITCRVNDQIRQMASTREMVFSVFQLMAFISGIMTLDVGDVLLTGTPAGVGPLQGGDSVQVEIEGIGILENPVVGAAVEPSATAIT
jgi:2-keto-4-pentenoate hydratase/2-oxohepta-3-ene-1,7-dioic acid hydratase in catechol pathway